MPTNAASKRQALLQRGRTKETSPPVTKTESSSNKRGGIKAAAEDLRGRRDHPAKTTSITSTTTSTTNTTKRPLAETERNGAKRIKAERPESSTVLPFTTIAGKTGKLIINNGSNNSNSNNGIINNGSNNNNNSNNALSVKGAPGKNKIKITYKKNPPASMMNLEIWKRIFPYLDIVTVVRLTMVSKQLYQSMPWSSLLSNPQHIALGQPLRIIAAYQRGMWCEKCELSYTPPPPPSSLPLPYPPSSSPSSTEEKDKLLRPGPPYSRPLLHNHPNSTFPNGSFIPNRPPLSRLPSPPPSSSSPSLSRMPYSTVPPPSHQLMYRPPTPAGPNSGMLPTTTTTTTTTRSGMMPPISTRSGMLGGPKKTLPPSPTTSASSSSTTTTTTSPFPLGGPMPPYMMTRRSAPPSIVIRGANIYCLRCEECESRMTKTRACQEFKIREKNLPETFVSKPNPRRCSGPSTRLYLKRDVMQIAVSIHGGSLWKFQQYQETLTRIREERAKKTAEEKEKKRAEDEKRVFAMQEEEKRAKEATEMLRRKHEAEAREYISNTTPEDRRYELMDLLGRKNIMVSSTEDAMLVEDFVHGLTHLRPEDVAARIAASTPFYSSQKLFRDIKTSSQASARLLSPHLSPTPICLSFSSSASAPPKLRLAPSASPPPPPLSSPSSYSSSSLSSFSSSHSTSYSLPMHHQHQHQQHQHQGGQIYHPHPHHPHPRPLCMNSLASPPPSLPVSFSSLSASSATTNFLPRPFSAPLKEPISRSVSPELPLSLHLSSPSSPSSSSSSASSSSSLDSPSSCSSSSPGSSYSPRTFPISPFDTHGCPEPFDVCTPPPGPSPSPRHRTNKFPSASSATIGANPIPSVSFLDIDCFLQLE